MLLYGGRYPRQDIAAAAGNVLAFADALEGSAWDEVWVTEHQFNDRIVGSSALALAALLLGRTQRLDVGTGVVVLPSQHPLLVAAQANLLGLLADHRFHLGVGRGQPLLDSTVLGAGLAQREGAFTELLIQLRQGLSGERFATAEGPHQHPALQVRPVCQPGVPVAVASNSAETTEAAAQLGLPLILGFAMPVPARLELLELYASVAQEHGHDPGAVDHIDSIMIEIGHSREEAMDTVLNGYVPWFTDVLAHAPPLPGHPPLAMRPGGLEETLHHQAIGTADECVDILRHHLSRTRCRRFLAFVESSCTRAGVLANIERIADEVLPHLSG